MTAHDILNRLASKEPVSIIRCGDGEKILLESNEDLPKQRRCLDSVMKRQMGYEPPLSHMEEIRENLIEAYNGADIIGVPMHKNIEELSSHWKDVEITLDKYCPNHTKQLCSIDVHYDMLNAGLFDILLTGELALSYISCRQIEEKMMARWSIGQVNGYHIAPEAKFTSGYDGPKHYPDQFIKVQRWMDKVCQPGMLLLVGAGVIGKIYCNWWRDRGGAAFDIGSIFDEWAGKVTRGPERGLDVVKQSEYTL